MNAKLFILILLVNVTSVAIASHSQYVNFSFLNLSRKTIVLSDFNLVWGKWIDCESWETVNYDTLTVEPSENSTLICAQGARATWTGTEGSFTINEKINEYQDVKLYQVVFDVPFFKPTNSLFIKKQTRNSRSNNYRIYLEASDLNDAKIAKAVIMLHEKLDDKEDFTSRNFEDSIPDN